METRKVQITGGSTFTVSLPKEWATEIDLETGDTLHLFPRDRTLIIEPDRGDEFWDTEVDIDDFSKTQVRRTIQALYTTGFNRITLSASTDLSSNRRVISVTARNLIGLETFESTETQITLQSLLDSTTVSVEQSAIQLRQIALSMHEDAVTALLEQDGNLAEHIVEQDNQVDRLYAMISRHFQRSLVSLQETEELELDQSELYDYQTTARQLERVADHAEKIANLVTQFENPPSTNFAEEIEIKAEASRRIVEQATSTIIGEADIETAHNALDRRDDLTTELQNLERKLHNQDIPESHLIALMLDSLTRTAEYGGNIAETALQTAARERRL
ncbi:phosphate signaling complex PhoU family protein [Halorubrum tebenquichense]|uniref:Transcriptional regulator n=1 Tax=Halorubrum tebenquichense DSM 14210 TaxID=1227485 RepID=M0DEA4_9EURY|nr:phosphate uptake regulator PhoU [Halorubrum tebenquichense]ELZ33128.1 transcriptional regulator [Halorubrum tebenquichense DSM 14210]